MALTAQYLTALKVLVALSGIKVGDMVQLVAQPSEHYGNELKYFDDRDIRDMQDHIGVTFEVIYIGTDYTICIEQEEDCIEFNVPVWCVIKEGSTKIELNDEYNAVVASDGKSVKVGCQTIPAEAVLKLAKAIEAAKKPAVAKKATKKVAKKVAKKVTRPAPCF